MNKPLTASTLRYFFLCLLVPGFFIITMLPGRAQSADQTFESFQTFPVSRYTIPRADHTGNNNYYDMTSRPNEPETLIASSGSEDMLVYSGHTFRIRRLKNLIYYQALDWEIGEARALLVGSKTPPDTGGAVVGYNPGNHSLSVVESVGTNLMGISMNPDGEGLIVGGSLLPEHRSEVFRYQDGSLEPLRSRAGPIFHDVEWHPRKRKALMVGEKGTVLQWSESDTFVSHELPHDLLLKTIDWHPTDDRALIGGVEGTLYLYENRTFTRITSAIQWNIQDVAWHPSGDFAVLVGGLGRDDQGYWGIYRNFQTRYDQIPGPLFSAAWIDDDNLLMGGQKVLFRASRDRRASDFNLTASLSVSNPEPTVSEAIELSGFGSTYQASADSVTSYRFRYGTGDTTPWRNNPNHRIEYLGAGTYHPQVEVRSKYDEGIQQASATVTVKKDDQSGFGGIDFFYWLTLMIFLASLTVAYATLRA